MKKGLLSAFLFFIVVISIAQSSAVFNPAYQPASSGDKLQDKNFYFLTLLQKNSSVREQLKKDHVLKAFKDDRLSSLQKISPACSDSTDCWFNFLYWTPEDNKAIKAALVAAYQSNNEFQKLVNAHMRACGYFELYGPLSNEEMIARAWQDAANAMNHIIKAYTTNKELQYPKIDSASYPVSGKYYRTLLSEMFEQINTYHKEEMQLFFEPALRVSLELLNINNRDEAVRYEPLTSANSIAYKTVKKINWNDFQYAALLVLGEGPDLDDVPISPYGKLRCKIAAENYRKKKAPFIIVSGGFVHPFQTKYCEAVEMKKYLIEECHIPESAIMIDPHARHTTTNIRNANRIIIRSRIPASKKVLCITSKAHADYIFNGKFPERCKNEMLHIPFEKINRLNSFELEYYPVFSSLHIYAMDPLDP